MADVNGEAATIEDLRSELAELRERVDALCELAFATSGNLIAASKLQQSLTALVKSVVIELMDVPADDDGEYDSEEE